ncbi:hypothetical protein, partial [Nonomuraea jabiensis]|uniref:hypothetical protein n=1 Tax=Nonomuraea jabiensis TaxID=882448 RepID=UPI0036B88390
MRSHTTRCASPPARSPPAPAASARAASGVVSTSRLACVASSGPPVAEDVARSENARRPPTARAA